MKKQYTKKQIQEAIQYWKGQLRSGTRAGLNESIDVARINPDGWYVVDNNTSVENADDETRQRVFDGELDFYDAAVPELFLTGEDHPDTGYATAEEANLAAFEEWGAYTDYYSYDDWLEDQESSSPGGLHLFSVSAGNGDSDPMDRFESEISVMRGRDLIRLCRRQH